MLALNEGRNNMQINNTSQYAIRILSYIAKNGSDNLLSAKVLSESLDIPYKFLTKIMTALVKADFVISIRGRDGGFKLSREASSITILEVLNAFNEFIDSDKCILGIDTCSGASNNLKCILHDKWLKPREMIKKMYKETTIENIEGLNFKN